MRVLVTGSAGFVGRELVPRLVAAGHEVTGVDIQTEAASTDPITHDLTDELSLDGERFDLCIHLASAVGGLLFNVGRRSLIQTNERINENVLALCRETGCPRFVFFSTINVFETSPTFEHAPLTRFDQRSPYAISKAQAEVFFGGAFEHSLVVRATNLFGRAQNRRHDRIGESHVIPELLHKIATSDVVEVFGDGSQVRNFLHVSDVCSFVLSNLDVVGRSWINVRSEITITIRQLVDELVRFSGKQVEIHFNPDYMRYEQFQIRNFDLGPAEQNGWRPVVESIADGLQL
jgi:UDP-glucose 4-epimerase